MPSAHTTVVPGGATMVLVRGGGGLLLSKVQPGRAKVTIKISALAIVSSMMIGRLT